MSAEFVPVPAPIVPGGGAAPPLTSTGMPSEIDDLDVITAVYSRIECAIANFKQSRSDKVL